jgi:hypothetical protein
VHTAATSSSTIVLESEQAKWFVMYREWLAKDEVHGAHCKLCVRSSIKAKDKLSTTGYGFVGEGAACTMVLIPSQAKITAHRAAPKVSYEYEKHCDR